MKMIKSVRAVFSDAVFLRKTVMIAVPVAAQALLNTVTNMVDTMMIGTLGETAIAGVGLANKVFFVFNLLIFGIASGASVLSAHFWGNHDGKNIRKVLGISLILGIIGSLLFTLPSFLAPEAVMGIFTNSPTSVETGAAYLRLACISYPFTAVTNIYVAAMRSVGRVRTPVVTSLIAIMVNITLNYALIFGHFGAPAMGVSGAAVATLTARVVEVTCIFLYVYGWKTELAAKVSDLIGYPKTLIKEYIRTVLPIIGNEFMWGLGVTMYSLAYGRMGDTSVAAVTIAQTIQDMILVFFQGISAASTVILGNELGAGRIKDAEKDASKLLWLQFTASILLAVFCIVTRNLLVGFYDVSETVLKEAAYCMLVYGLFLPFKMFNIVNVVGVLRSGGDTRFCLMLDSGSVWLIGVPMSFLGALVFRLPIHLVFAMTLTEEFAKFFIGYRRYKKKRWLKNLAAGVS
ncbi:MATE family efflux transporter [Qiania dongpingensis]|uniref:Probable multidrug resistance protein NorM n=1 Tax=Qiania dongpingensis TaxID=2763669 RepID=A0A7G9G429_9FIRM|nr:MATE family efflux transporter [Qiania dongpingensis]QNM05561.1 MATE family efflux transporter [Qiania dongpingensis]